MTFLVNLTTLGDENIGQAFTDNFRTLPLTKVKVGLEITLAQTVFSTMLRTASAINTDDIILVSNAFGTWMDSVDKASGLT